MKIEDCRSALGRLSVIDQFGSPDDSRPERVCQALLGIYDRGRCSSDGRWQFDREKSADNFAKGLTGCAVCRTVQCAASAGGILFCQKSVIRRTHFGWNYESSNSSVFSHRIHSVVNFVQAVVLAPLYRDCGMWCVPLRHSLAPPTLGRHVRRIASVRQKQPTKQAAPWGESWRTGHHPDKIDGRAGLGSHGGGEVEFLIDIRRITRRFPAALPQCATLSPDRTSPRKLSPSLPTSSGYRHLGRQTCPAVSDLSSIHGGDYVGRAAFRLPACRLSLNVCTGLGGRGCFMF